MVQVRPLSVGANAQPKREERKPEPTTGTNYKVKLLTVALEQAVTVPFDNAIDAREFYDKVKAGAAVKLNLAGVGHLDLAPDGIRAVTLETPSQIIVTPKPIKVGGIRNQ
jgi:hypothetical protein